MAKDDTQAYYYQPDPEKSRAMYEAARNESGMYNSNTDNAGDTKDVNPNPYNYISLTPGGLYDYENARKAYEAEQLDGVKPAVTPAGGSTTIENPYQAKQDEALNEYLGRLADVTEKPVSADERKRREQSVNAISGINALGRVASSFANLIYAPKGATAIEPSKGVDAATLNKNYRTEQQELADKYVAASGKKLSTIAAAKQDWDKNQALKQESARQLTQLQLQIAKAEQEGKLNDVKLLTEQWKAEKAKYDAYDSSVKANYEEQNQQADLANKAAQTTQHYANANASTARANKTNMESYKTIQGGNKVYNIPINSYNIANLSAVIHEMGGNAVNISRTIDADTGISKQQKDAMKIEQMSRWIGLHLAGNVKGQNAMARLAAGQPIQQYKGSMPGSSSHSGSSTHRGGSTMPGVGGK